MMFTVGVFVLLLLFLSGIILFFTLPAGMQQALGLLVSLAALAPLLLYAAIIFVDSTIKNDSEKIGLLSIRAAFVQLLGYGCGFLQAWWRRCVRGKDEFAAFEKTFYK